MKYINDYEVDSLKEIPLFVGSAIRAVRCMHCNSIKYANYLGFDYECMSCRTTTLTP